MTSLPYMKFYHTDYLADTVDFTTVEHGAYLLLILHYWREGQLPDNESKLRRITRMSAKEWAISRDALSSKFSDGWRHNRIDRELEKVADKVSARSSAGKAGAEARWQKPSGCHPVATLRASGSGSGSDSGSLSTCQGIEVRRAILGAHKLRSVGDAA